MAEPTTPRRPPLGSASALSSSAASSSRTPSTPAANNLTEDMDDPTSTPTAYRSSSTPSVPNNADDSADEDEAPDYLRLLSTLNPKSKGATAANANIVIPKRGEKDFEPTGFGGQSKLLERSREAMYQAVSGERTVGSRSLVKATWHPKTRRARLHDVQGKIFETVGVIRRTQVVDKQTGKTHTKATNELLPEEALFLAERGSLQIYQQSNEGELEPMSLQQAFALLMLPPSQQGEGDQDEALTREAYLIYAYLKRLGYVVQRAKIVDAVRAAPVSAATLARKNQSSSSASGSQGASAQGLIADPQRPIRLVTNWDVLLYIPRRIAQLGGDAARVVARWIHRLFKQTVGRLIALVSRQFARRRNVGSLGLGLGLELSGRQDGRRFLGEKGNVEWDSYNAVFSSLQIVSSGHDFTLPSSSPSTSSNSTPSATIQQTPSSTAPHPSSSALSPFYYAWRPATVYRKSHPPPPEFRIVIVNARTHGLPNLWEFQSLFSHIPIPGSDAELFGTISHSDEQDGLSDEQVRERVEYEKALKASNEAKNRAAYGKFSEGKQKFLREKAAARQAANAQRAAERVQNQKGLQRVYSTLMASHVGRAMMKVVLLDAAWVRVLARLFRHCPGCWEGYAQARSGGKWRSGGARGKMGAGGEGRGGVGNVFPPLKAGRRSVVVAVVDGSITTLLRFGESEFAHWALYGTKPQPQQQEHKS